MFQYCHILVVHWIHFLFHSFCRPLAGSIVNFKIPLFRKTLFRRSTYQSHYTRFDSGLGIKGPGMPTFRRCITCKYIIFKRRSFFLLFCFWSKLSITIIYLSNFHELIFLVGGRCDRNTNVLRSERVSAHSGHHLLCTYDSWTSSYWSSFSWR